MSRITALLKRGTSTKTPSLERESVSSEHLVATAPLGGANVDSVRFVQLSAVRKPS
jgi:hypothetical protein